MSLRLFLLMPARFGYRPTSKLAGADTLSMLHSSEQDSNKHKIAGCLSPFTVIHLTRTPVSR